MNKEIIKGDYDRDTLRCGIVHIGPGNFHRAHLEFYTDRLLSLNASQKDWGICGVMLLPGDANIYHALKEQAGKYTLTVCGRNGGDEVYEIASLKELIWGVENREEAIEKMASPDTKIISMTITEGGYNINKQTGEFMLDTPAIAADLKNPQVPTSAFGFVAEGLRRRMLRGEKGVTILTCDNLQHNGDTARKAFMSFFEAQDAQLAEWVKRNVTFPNSMVDRITPATRCEDMKRLNEQNGTEDKAPVYCEDFIQWVVEDNFANGRPEWEKVGVEFTEDVTAYENMKLSLLNASHTLLSYPSFLLGFRKVDEAMHDDRIIRYVRDFMDKDFTPYVPAPGNTDLELYKQTLIERFGNRTVSDQIARLCFDGISKFPVYVMPHLGDMIRDGKDVSRIAFLFAAYRHYLKYRRDDNGAEFEIAEPAMTAEDKEMIASDKPIDFLGLSAFGAVDLKNSKTFTEEYLKYVDMIASAGAKSYFEK